MDEPNAHDRRLLTAARRIARNVMMKADTHRQVVRHQAFRAELGPTVRSASPFLLSLLAVNGLALDDVVQRMRPLTRWPLRPGVSDMLSTRSPLHPFLRHDAVGRYPNDRLPGTRASIMLPTDCGGWMAIRVEAHSVEVSACLDDLSFFTRFGSLEIRLPARIPETLAAASPGRPADDLVGHPAIDGRGWRVVACEVEVDGQHGTVIGVETGAAVYRLPWAR